MKQLIAAISSIALLSVAASGNPGTVQPRAWLPLAGYQICPSGVSVLSSRATSDQYGLYVKGEICNGTDNSLANMQVPVDLYNGAQFIDTASDYPYIGLRPGDRTCFMVQFSLPAVWTHYVFEPISYSTFGASTPNLTITTVITTYNPSTQEYHIAGLVRNDDKALVHYAHVIVTTYNAAKGVTWCGSTNVNVTELYPGQSSAFSLSTYGLLANIVSFRLQPTGSMY